jgi:hypothetical protein
MRMLGMARREPNINKPPTVLLSDLGSSSGQMAFKARAMRSAARQISGGGIVSSFL